MDEFEVMTASLLFGFSLIAGEELIKQAYPVARPGFLSNFVGLTPCNQIHIERVPNNSLSDSVSFLHSQKYPTILQKGSSTNHQQSNMLYSKNMTVFALISTLATVVFASPLAEAKPRGPSQYEAFVNTYPGDHCDGPVLSVHASGAGLNQCYPFDSVGSIQVSGRSVSPI